MKICSKCGIEKPTSEYHYKRGKTQNRCKACRSKYQKAHYLANRERERAVRKAWYEANKSSVCEKLRRQYKDTPEKFVFARKRQKYGLTKAKYEEMLSEQKNSCEICRTTFVKTPYVDHCHETGKVRGLLCNQCNTAFGLLKEDVAIFESCIAYAKKYKK